MSHERMVYHMFAYAMQSDSNIVRAALEWGGTALGAAGVIIGRFLLRRLNDYLRNSALERERRRTEREQEWFNYKRRVSALTRDVDHLKDKMLRMEEQHRMLHPKHPLPRLVFEINTDKSPSD